MLPRLHIDMSTTAVYTYVESLQPDGTYRTNYYLLRPGEKRLEALFPGEGILDGDEAMITRQQQWPKSFYVEECLLRSELISRRRSA